MTDYRNLFDLSGRKALVLGAASGIGQASAQALGALGAVVHCADIKLEEAEATAKSIRDAGGEASASRCDAASGSDIAALAARTLSGLGRIDIAVTTPGINIRKTLFDYTEEDFDRVSALNFKGAFHFFREFGRIMVKQGGGSIIASSSIRAQTIEPGLAVYGATKAAISLLVKGFAAEVGAHGVRVNAIAPSIIETPLTAPIKAKTDIYQTYAKHTVLNRWGQTSEVASAVAFLASDAASYISGSTLLIDAGWMGIDGPPTGLTQTAAS
ncbi:MAG TPA: SDR family NAD(P)-dependent oxidoreductase [Burkholderiales bacterium]|jgi:NAD(P)-dependent dehydrogenase (short-subunit alcohol dehydrogenase family)